MGVWSWGPACFFFARSAVFSTHPVILSFLLVIFSVFCQVNK